MITKVQLRVLRKMVEVDTTVMIVNVRGGSSTFFRGLLGEPDGKNVQERTVFALKKKGLVENITESALRWRGSEYRITDEGRGVCRAAHKGEG